MHEIKSLIVIDWNGEEYGKYEICFETIVNHSTNRIFHEWWALLLFNFRSYWLWMMMQPMLT